VRLIVVRHGESEGNAGGFVQGRLDFGLTDLGRAQAQATARRLATMKVDRLITSPLVRAAQTAAYFAEALHLEAVPEPALMEYDMGEASGLTGPQIRERFPHVVAAYQEGRRPSFPGEEGRDTFHARVNAVLDSLSTSGDTVVAVSHGGVVSALCYSVVGLDPHRRGAFEAHNCSLTEIHIDRAGHRMLLRHNDTCHLHGMTTTVDRG
jgi:broad specificity phosphatase PhoE